MSRRLTQTFPLADLAREKVAGTGHLFVGQVKLHPAGKRQDVGNLSRQAHV